MMREYASNDKATRRQLAQERIEQAEVDFANDPGDEPNDDWQAELVVDKHGHVKDTLGNLVLILRNQSCLTDAKCAVPILFYEHRAFSGTRHLP